MRTSKYTEEQIIGSLRQAEARMPIFVFVHGYFLWVVKERGLEEFI